MHDYEALHYDKEQLKEACEWQAGKEPLRALRAGQGAEGERPAADGLLCPPAVPLGTVVVPGDSDLELCRAHIERLQQVRASGAGPAWAHPP